MVWREPGKPGLVEEVQLDPPSPGEVLVRLEAAGVCHSDLHLALGHLGHHRFPTVLGHEGAGVVESVGDGVSDLSPGERVAFCFIPPCGACRYCRVGRANLCEPGSAAAFAGVMLDGTSRLEDVGGGRLQAFLGIGAFAERVVTARAGLVKVPAALDPAQAALAGCAAVTGFGAVNNVGRVQPGQDVAVIGCGGVGLQVIAAAVLAGADSITAVDLVREKRELAMRHGATAAVDQLAGHFDVVFEVVGRPETIRTAWHHLRPGGSVVVVGISPRGAEASLSAIEFSGDKSLKGSFYGSGNPAAEIASIMDLIVAGKVDLSATVTHTTDLAGINDAFDRMGRGEGVRTVVRP